MRFDKLRGGLSTGRKVRTTVCLDAEDYNYLRQLARSQGLSFADVVRFALKQWVSQRRRRP
jgi:hypothetical protein